MTALPAPLRRFVALLAALVPDRLARGVRDERGDVPGWVLITIMSAGLVILLWTVAGDLLVQVFTDAIQRVSGH